MADSKISALPAATTPLAGTELVPVVQGGATDNVTVGNLTAGRGVAAHTLTLTATGAGIPVTCGGSGTAFTYNKMYNTGGQLWQGLEGAAGGDLFAGTSPYDAILGTVNATNLHLAGGAAGVKLENSSGDAIIKTGNLKLATAAKGINFTANTPASGMTSQLLNWYEEGTFTPTYTSTGTPPTVTYSHQYGKYTRIGRQVFFTVEIGTDSATSGTGILAVGGLPFTAVNNRFTGTFSVGYATGFTTASPSGGYVFANETIARLTYEDSATSKTEMLTTFLTNGTGQNYLVISGSYIV